jgi:cytoskeletal protein CcmA (bactofilin family)
MSFWKDHTSFLPKARPGREARGSARVDAPSGPDVIPIPAAVPGARADAAPMHRESLLAADITLEGRIDGGGSVRIAGKFKGNVSLEGDLTIESGAKLTGNVRADRVTIAGELIGNVEESSHVVLTPTGGIMGDLRTGSLTVAPGAWMRGRVEFGREDGKSSGSR